MGRELGHSTPYVSSHTVDGNSRRHPARSEDFPVIGACCVCLVLPKALVKTLRDVNLLGVRGFLESFTLATLVLRCSWKIATMIRDIGQHHGWVWAIMQGNETGALLARILNLFKIGKRQPAPLVAKKLII